MELSLMKNVILLTTLISTLFSCVSKKSIDESLERNVAGTEVSQTEVIIDRGDFDEILSFDPLTKYFWPLSNTGQTVFAKRPGDTGNDLNLLKTITQRTAGRGVRIAISDTGVEIDHEDLRDNMLSGEHRNYHVYGKTPGTDPTPTSTSAVAAHGTNVAGIIAAIAGNGIGSRGIAPQAKIAAFKYTGGRITISNTLDQTQGDFDIFNYSYGSNQCKLAKVSTSIMRSLDYQVTFARGGKGSIYVKAGGNEWSGQRSSCPSAPKETEGKFYGNTNNEAENTVPYYIVVGATNAIGQLSSYSTPGPNLWVVAPGGEDGVRYPAILTTDITGCDSGRSSAPIVIEGQKSKKPMNAFEFDHPLNTNCNYTSTMNGSSAATPMVTGVIALMLETNPDLSWRDVKHILAVTSKKLEDSKYTSQHPNRKTELPQGYVYQEGWTTNGAGISFHNWYGFGQVDGDKAVSMAKTYSSNMGPQIKLFNKQTYTSSYKSSPSKIIPDFDSSGATDTIEIDRELTVEAVQIRITTTHQNSQELAVELYSPNGTKSILLNAQNGIRDKVLKNVMLGTNAFYGEKSLGDWKIKVIDTARGSDIGSLVKWSLLIYGRAVDDRIDREAPMPPTKLSIVAGDAPLIMSSPMFTWAHSESTDVTRYEISVGTTPEGLETLDWIDIGLKTNIQLTMLEHKIIFFPGTKYYFHFRAIDANENTSLPILYEWTVE